MNGPCVLIKLDSTERLPRPNVEHQHTQNGFHDHVRNADVAVQNFHDHAQMLSINIPANLSHHYVAAANFLYVFITMERTDCSPMHIEGNMIRLYC